MAENVTNDLLLEHMKRMQDRLARIEDKQDEALRRLGRVEKRLVEGESDYVDLQERLDKIGSRVDRIERRLELREAE